MVEPQLMVFSEWRRNIVLPPSFMLYGGNEMRNSKKKREMVPMYSAKDFFTGKKGAKPVGRMSNPDGIGPVLVDRATLFRLMAERRNPAELEE